MKDLIERDAVIRAIHKIYGEEMQEMIKEIDLISTADCGHHGYISPTEARDLWREAYKEGFEDGVILTMALKIKEEGTE